MKSRRSKYQMCKNCLKGSRTILRCRLCGKPRVSWGSNHNLPHELWQEWQRFGDTPITIQGIAAHKWDMEVHNDQARKELYRKKLRDSEG